MVRLCVVCRVAAREGLEVFPFPRCGRRRGSWLASLPPLPLTCAEGWSPGKQHGVCERHFLPRELRRGSRTSLTRRAAPVRSLCYDTPLTEMTQSQATTLSLGARSDTEDPIVGEVREDGLGEEGRGGGGGRGTGRRGSRWQVADDQEFDPSDCMSVDVNHYMSPDDTFVESSNGKIAMEGEEGHSSEHICLVCGRKSENLDLVCVLRVCEFSSSVSLSVLVAKIVGRSKREVTCMSAKMCSRCRGLVQEVAQIEDDLKTKKHVIKEMFESTLQNQREKSKVILGSAGKALRPEPIYPEEDCSSHLMAYRSRMEDCKEGISGNYIPDKPEEDSRKSSRRQASVKKFCCPQCKEEFTSLALWVHHLSRHSDAEELGSQNKTKAVTPKIKRKPRSGSHACKECGKTFVCKQTLLAHSSAHQKGSDCSVCGRYLTTRARLKAHLFKFHGIGEEKDKEVECQDCEKRFGTKAGLRYHRNVVHHVGRKYVCEHCNKIFHYHVPYRSHMLYSHGEKKIVCETCGDKFFTISKLNTHINAVHRGAQTWTCDKCEDKFTTHTAYRHHINVKHLKVRHTCDYCSAQFRKRSSFLVHLCKHSVYICHMCRENFSCGDALRTHMSVAHGKEMTIKGKRKQSMQHIQGKKLVVAQKAPVPDQQVQQSEHVASIVINDLLMTAESYDNTSLPSFSLAACEKMLEKDAFSNDEIKVKTLSMMDASQQLPDSVDPGPFSTVETLEVKSGHIEMPPQHIEMSPECIELPPEHIEMPPEPIEMTSEHTEIPSEHIEIPPEAIEMPPEPIDMPPEPIEMPPEPIEMPPEPIVMPPEPIAMPPEHIEMPPEHTQIPSDHIKVGHEHIEIGSDHIEMAQGVSLINVQILGEMEMAQGSEDTLGSEDMLAGAAHHLAMPPLDPHLTENLEASGHALETPGHVLETSGHALEESSHSLVVSSHSLDTQGHGLEVPGHALEVSSHAFVSSPVLEPPSLALESPDHALEVSGHSHALEAASHSHALEAANHTLEATDHTLEVPGHTLEVPDHTLEAPDHNLEDPLESTEDPHHPLPSASTHICSPLQPMMAQMEGKDGPEGGVGAEGGLEEKVELQPFSMTLDSKGVKYQYVMYISTSAEDTSQE